MLWARAKSTSTRARLCSCARIRARVSMTSPVTSWALRVEATTSPSLPRSVIAASKSELGMRRTTFDSSTSPPEVAVVFSSAIEPPNASTTFSRSKRAAATSSLCSVMVPIEMTAGAMPVGSAGVAPAWTVLAR